MTSLQRKHGQVTKTFNEKCKHGQKYPWFVPEVPKFGKSLASFRYQSQNYHRKFLRIDDKEKQKIGPCPEIPCNLIRYIYILVIHKVIPTSVI